MPPTSHPSTPEQKPKVSRSKNLSNHPRISTVAFSDPRRCLAACENLGPSESHLIASKALFSRAMSSIRTRGQKLKQKQLGLPASPPLQLATPPRRPRVIKKVPAQIQQNNKQSLDNGSEIIFNFNYLPPSPQTLRQPIVLDKSSTEDSQALPNGFPEVPIVLDLPLIATDGTTPMSIHTAAPVIIPAASHTILHFWLDAAQEDLASARPDSDPSIAVALPSALIPDLLHYISILANSARTNTLTVNAASIGISPRSARSNKRKLGEDAEISQAAQRVRVEISQEPKRQKRRGVFSRRPIKDLNFTPPSPTSPNSHGLATNFKRESLYSKDGSLQLGLVATSQIASPPRNETIIAQPTEAEVEQGDLDERIQPAEGAPMVAQTPTQNQAVVENPRSGRWGFGDLLKSARSVSKFLPGFQRAPPIATPIDENIATDRNSYLDLTPPAVDRSATNLDTASQSGVAQAVQLQNPQPVEQQGMPEIQDSRRRVTNRQNKSSKTGIQAGQKKADRDRKVGASKSKDPESFAESTKNSTPGRKRKRMPSPDSIPNPVGSSYGMDLDYFGFSSSDEEDEMMVTPSKPRPSKHRRLHGPDRQETVVQVDVGKVQPHKGVSFTSKTMSYGGRNAFNETTAIKSSKLQTKQSPKEDFVRRTQQNVSPKTPIIITNLTGTFRVPSPSDSDSDPEDTPTAGTPETISTQLASKGQDISFSTSASTKTPLPRVDENSKTGSSAGKEKTSRTQSSPNKAVTLPPKTAPTTWTQPPPPRPNPPHAALPSVSSADSEALARARKKALHYQPHKPSGLRASSRISSPRILEDSNAAVTEGNKTLTNQNGKSGDIDTALSVRSENAVVTKLPQAADTSSNSERVEILSKKQVVEIATKENSTSLDVARSASFTYVRDPKIEACIDAFWKDENTKEASDTFEGLYAAFLAKQ